jgi:hypothetical protein
MDGINAPSAGFSWDRYAPARNKLWLVFGFWAGLSALTGAVMYAIALGGASEIMIGGDFSAFHIAAQAAADGAAAQLYDAAAFQARLNDVFPGRDDLGLSWQYPPTYFLAIAMFASLPYLAGFSIFSGATAGAYALLLRKRISDNLLFFAIIASPSAFIALTTGQNGFLTAALLILAAGDPKQRPIIAGIAAGLLTMKPHLGLLIPVAYIALGCWRAIGVATITAIALAGLSVLAYGAEPWIAFVGAVGEVSARVSEQVMPLSKMATPYSAALYAGLPEWPARIVHVALALLAVAAVWRVWRTIDDVGLRAAAPIAGVFLAAPYGYYYELIILGFPVAVIVMRAMETGWLRYEKWMLAAVWVLSVSTPMFAETRHGISTGFVIALLVFVLTMRRASIENPGLLTQKLTR